MNNELKITVTGAAGAGKTLMSIVIEQALVQAGFKNVDVIDEETSDVERASMTETLQTRTKNLDIWKSRTDVIINTVQARRIPGAKSIYND